MNFLIEIFTSKNVWEIHAEIDNLEDAIDEFESMLDDNEPVRLTYNVNGV